MPSHVTFWGWGKRLSFRLGSVVEEVVRYSPGCENCCCYCLFFNLVSSKLLLSEPVIFMLCVFYSLLHPAEEAGRGRGK